MASATVKAAVEARLAAWPGLSSCPFFDENDAAPLPSTQHVTIEYPVASEDRINIGARPAIFRETGAIRFVVHILSMSGLNDTIALVDTWANNPSIVVATADTEISDVSATTLTVAAGGAAFVAAMLTYVSGFLTAANNKLARVSA